MLFTKYYGVTVLEYIVLVIIVFLLIFYVIIQHKAKNIEMHVKNIDKSNSLNFATVDDLLQNANNGDLVFMSGDSRGERVCRWFSGSMYSHVGMLFREIHPATGEDVLYIWDADIGQGYRNGPRVMKLQDKLDKYKGFKYLLWTPLIGERPTTENIMKIVAKYKDYGFDDWMLSWIHPIFKSKESKDVFCSELIALTMQELDMLATQYRATSYSPASFLENVKGLHEKYIYSDGMYVKFEEF